MIDEISDETLRKFAQISLEQATLTIAEKARRMADVVPPDVSGRDALLAFAYAIESTNAKVWPSKDEKLQ